jgi:hypothetical protein
VVALEEVELAADQFGESAASEHGPRLARP